nr:reverse transcriptase domain-containing protein [Tanacetum cinerariifolium]
ATTIVLGHKIFKNGIEVDKAKVDVISKLPHPTTIKGVRSFLGHFGAVLGQCPEKHFRPIHYASKIMTEAELDYTTIEKEMLTVVYAFKKFWSYLILNKSIVYTDHSALKYVFAKKIPRRDCSGGFSSFKSSNSKEKFRNGMKCLKIPSKFEIFLTFRASISWGRSRLHEGTTFKTPIGCTPYKLVYEKACHLLIELENKAYWAFKHCTYDLLTVGDHCKVQLNELNKLRDQAYENSLIYKEKTKRIHDSKIKDRVFNVGDRVLLFNSKLNIFSGKLKTRWSGPFTITQVFPYGTVELSQTDVPNFKVNGHRLKHYFGEDIPKLVFLDLQTFPKNQ